MDGIDSIKKIAQILPKQGITSFLPTTISSHLSHLLQIMGDIKTVCADRTMIDCSQILGVHYESPYITTRGAHLECVVDRAKELSVADLKQEIETLHKVSGNNIKILTMCPVFKGNKTPDIIKFVTSLGINVSVGHSIATYEETMEGIKSGAMSGTHLFNAMTPLHHRKPGMVGALLENEKVFVEIIPDCNSLPHLHPAVINLTVKAKGVDKTIIITDTAPVADLENGKYTIYSGQEVIIEDDIVYILKDESSKKLAGSALAMDQAVRNMYKIVGVPLKSVMRMASTNPAALLGLEKKGDITKGKDADLIVFDDNIDIQLTMIKGKVVYQKNKY